jgi:hypothetical protein
MRIISALVLCALSTSAVASDFNGVWATSAKVCKSEWVRITDTLIVGKDWKCTLIFNNVTANEKTSLAFCGYDKTDITFQDSVTMYKSGNNTLNIDFQGGRTTLVKCK